MANEKENQVQAWIELKLLDQIEYFQSQDSFWQINSIRVVAWRFIQETVQIEKVNKLNSLEQDGREGETPVN